MNWVVEEKNYKNCMKPKNAIFMIFFDKFHERAKKQKTKFDELGC